jgi:hypothetical protein
VLDQPPDVGANGACGREQQPGYDRNGHVSRTWGILSEVYPTPMS